MREKDQRVQRTIVGILLAFLLSACTASVSGQAPDASPVASPFATETLRQWLTVISSDEFEGRATFSPGLDRAAYYIADRLKDAGVKPAGENGSYLQPVAVQTIESMNQSTLTVEVNGQSQTFRNGDGVYFPANVGGKRTFTLSGAEFVGYGLNLGSSHNDYAGKDVRGKAVVWVGDSVPLSVTVPSAARMMESRTSMAVEEMGATLSISPAFGLSRGRDRGSSRFITTQRLDLPRPVDVMVSDEVLALLFNGAPSTFEEVQTKLQKQESLSPMKLEAVKLTVNIDADYRVITTRMTQNVVGFIEGSDPQLKATYVAFGAHYDHLGIEQTGRSDDGVDRIYNGADDDGSGTTAVLALAHAFMKSPRPRRSLMFAWHAGEEMGLWGSQYLVDHPPVPMENIVAQLNIDMIGRNRDNLASEENSLYPVGADRISTELHNVLIEANNSLASPVKLDFEMNDPSDPERIYFRSDHFSYASKGIPIIFFFTGLHSDYHKVTDSVDRIHFEKMSNITRLIYELGVRLANMDHAPKRDFKGPRMGKGSSGKIQ